jgi:hypothetical protein
MSDMLPTKHIVAYIDILGFKEIIEKYFSGKINSDYIDKLDKSLDRANDFMTNINNANRNNPIINFNFKKKQFSDCVSISSEFSDSIPDYLTVGYFLFFIRLYELLLLQNKIYIRGGISIGGHFENSNMIFSEALVKSFLLEKDKAIYPRIIIDEKVLEIIDRARTENTIEFKNNFLFYGHAIIKDWDNTVFISPFDLSGQLDNNHLQHLEESLQKKLKESGNNIQNTVLIFNNLISNMICQILKDVESQINTLPDEKYSIKAKYIWLKEFINWNIEPSNSNIKFKKLYK